MAPACCPEPSLRHTIWLRQANLAFVYLPKVACTSWKLFLAQALHGSLPADLSYADVHLPKRLALPLVALMASHEQEQFHQGVQQGAIALVAMLREPRARILSAYLDKIENRPNPRSYFRTVVRPAIQAFHGLPTERIPTFLQFLQWIQAAEHPASANDHWQPMHQLLGLLPGHTQGFARLWRLDEIEEAAISMNRWLGCDVPFPTFTALGPRPASGSRDRLEQIFADAEVQQLFEALYGADLRLYQR